MLTQHSISKPPEETSKLHQKKHPSFKQKQNPRVIYNKCSFISPWGMYASTVHCVKSPLFLACMCNIFILFIPSHSCRTHSFLLLLASLALIKSSMSQAPLDYDNICRTNFRFANDHIFPENWKILLDSYDYQNLIGTVWEPVDADQDGLNVS